MHNRARAWKRTHWQEQTDCMVPALLCDYKGVGHRFPREITPVFGFCTLPLPAQVGGAGWSLMGMQPGQEPSVGQAGCSMLAVPFFLHSGFYWPWQWELSLELCLVHHTEHHSPSQPAPQHLHNALGEKLVHGTHSCCVVLRMPVGSAPQVKKQCSANKSIKAFSVCHWTALVPRSQPALGIQSMQLEMVKVELGSHQKAEGKHLVKIKTVFTAFTIMSDLRFHIVVARTEFPQAPLWNFSPNRRGWLKGMMAEYRIWNCFGSSTGQQSLNC